MSQQPAPRTIEIDMAEIGSGALWLLKWSLWLLLWTILGFAEYNFFGAMKSLMGASTLTISIEILLILIVGWYIGISVNSMWRAMVWIIGSIISLVIIDIAIKSLNSAFGTNRMLIVCEWITFVVFPLTVFWLMTRRKVTPLGGQLSASDLETLSSIKWHLGTGNTLHEKLLDVNNAIELMKKEKYIP